MPYVGSYDKLVDNPVNSPSIAMNAEMRRFLLGWTLKITVYSRTFTDLNRSAKFNSGLSFQKLEKEI